jgi:exportin-T
MSLSRILNLTCKSAGRDNQIGVVFYLRVLGSVHEEIGDEGK